MSDAPSIRLGSPWTLRLTGRPSLGDADGLGETRKKELVKSGLALGLRKEDDVFVVESPYARLPLPLFFLLMRFIRTPPQRLP